MAQYLLGDDRLGDRLAADRAVRARLFEQLGRLVADAPSGGRSRTAARYSSSVIAPSAYSFEYVLTIASRSGAGSCDGSNSTQLPRGSQRDSASWTLTAHGISSVRHQSPNSCAGFW